MGMPAAPPVNMAVFSTASKFRTHQEMTSITEVLHRPAGPWAGIFDANFRMLVVVNEGEEGQSLRGNAVLKLNALEIVSITVGEEVFCSSWTTTRNSSSKWPSGRSYGARK